jgi:hypothetical protein
MNRVAGFALHLLLLPIILIAGLVVPVWAVALFLVVWAVGLYAMVRNRERPRIVTSVPVIVLAVFAVGVVVGKVLLDWEA